MEFSPFNPVVKLCLSGMEMEAKGDTAEALRYFQQGWNEATDDFERFLAAHYIARQQKNTADQLKWLETTLECARKVDDVAIQSAFPALYANLAACSEKLNDHDKAKEYSALAVSSKNNPADKGPFYHGTKADLKTGDLLVAGGNSNYQSELKMNHIYFTGMVNGAGLAAALAKGERKERVYIVEPTGDYENDPNLTDKKFPGNPTRSYRSDAPLKIVGEVTDWVRPAPEQLQAFRQKVDNSNGEIIN